MLEKDRPQIKSELLEISLTDLLKYLFSHRKILLLIAGTVSAGLVSWVTFMRSPQYRSSAIVQLITEDNLGAIQVPNFTNFFDEKNVAKKMYVLESLVESRQFKKMLYEEVFGQGDIIGTDAEIDAQKKILRTFYAKQVSDPETRQDVLPSNLRLAHEKENDTLIISAVTGSAPVSQALASVAGRLLMAFNYNNNLTQIRAIKLFLEKLTDETKIQLHGVEAELTNLQVAEKSFSLQEVSSYYDRSQVELKTKLRELQNRFHANEVLLAQFKTELKSYLVEMKSGTPSYLYLMQLQKKIDLLKYQMQVNSSDRLPASEGDSKVQLNQLIQDFEKELGRNQNDWSMNSWDYWQSLEKNVSELKSKQKILHGEIEAQENSLKSQGKDFEKFPVKIQKLTELRREIEMTQKLYGELQAKLQETKVREAGQKNNLQMVFEPGPPVRPEGLGLLNRILMSLTIGLSLAIGLLLTRYFFMPTLRSKQDLLRMQLNCIAEIPRSNLVSKLGGKDKYQLVINETSHNPESTAFRNFRFRMERILVEAELEIDNSKQARIATFFSINNDEGKTFTVANLGTALSLVGKKVLMVDLDHRKPELGKYFTSAKKIPMEKKIKSAASDHFERFQVTENLEFLQTFPIKENFSDWLESHDFDQTLAMLRNSYDLILVDTPPLDRNFEAVVASKFSDMMIMVVNQRSTLRQDIVKLDQSVREVYKGPVYSVLNFAYDEIKVA